SLSEVSLRHEFELNFSVTVEAVEHPRVSLARERADHLAHAPLRKQRSKANVSVASVVAHDREVAGTLLDQRVDQLNWLTGSAEPSDQYGRSVCNAGNGIFNGR